MKNNFEDTPFTFENGFLTLPNTVTRFEVIDENGRAYIKRGIKEKIQISFQDDNRTVKIFLK